MVYLVLGLVLFLGVHSVRIVAEPWRTRTLQQMGEGPYKGVYSVLSLLGFALIVWGFGVARQTPVVLWTPPVGMRHAASLLTLLAFVLMVAAYVPGNAFKARLRHPMVLAVALWSLAHLMSAGFSTHLVLFGSFLLWSVLDYVAARRRDQQNPPAALSGRAVPTVLTALIGAAAWAGFALWGHGVLIGIRPFGV